MPLRRTRIICTLGPATKNYESLERLYEAGMNAVRINMSHADHDMAARLISWVKKLNRQVQFPLPVLLDTQGPELRTGERDTRLNLRTGDEVTVAVLGDPSVEERSIQVNYDLVGTLKVGDRLTVDNGLINLNVLAIEGTTLRCKVLDGGMLGSKKHVNLPGIRVNLPALTLKDERDIAFAVGQEVDFIALSFVRGTEDVAQLRQMLGPDERVKIISKIENFEGVNNSEAIVCASDGVMVARGDLGVEIDIAQLPNVQRRITRYCAELGRRSIVATHLLESMIHNPLPTRAEVTDVANAVYEEVDAVLLSGETSIGKYPVRCVEQLDDTIRAAESHPGLRYADRLKSDSDRQHMARAAVSLAESMEAKGLITITRRGRMADSLSNCRPVTVPIFAFTDNDRTRRQLMLSRSVTPYRIAFSEDDSEATLQSAFHILEAHEGFSAGDKLVVISDVTSEPGIDWIQTRTL